MVGVEGEGTELAAAKLPASWSNPATRTHPSHHLIPQHRPSHTRTQGESDEQVLRRLRPGHGRGLVGRHHAGVCPSGQVSGAGGREGGKGGRNRAAFVLRNDSRSSYLSFTFMTTAGCRVRRR